MQHDSLRSDETRPRILVVDDMQDNLFLMNGLLEDRYDVVQAASGQEALDVVMSATPPDMVLLDIMMPDMDGYEVLRRMRQHAPSAAIPVIFLTALASSKDEQLGRELGAMDYLTKPIDPVQVIGRVEAHIAATLHTKRMNELTERMARHLSAAAWQSLVDGPDRRTIRFQQKTVTLVYAESHHPGSIANDVGWLAARYRARIDPFVYGAAVAWLDDPRLAVQMAMDLQRSAHGMQLRVGVHTAPAVIASFESGAEVHAALLGPAVGQAARTAGAAATGSIMLSPGTYALVQRDLHTDTAGCLLMEEFHDDETMAQACITPAPAAMSSFAGLGLT